MISKALTWAPTPQRRQKLTAHQLRCWDLPGLQRAHGPGNKYFRFRGLIISAEMTQFYCYSEKAARDNMLKKKKKKNMAVFQ